MFNFLAPEELVEEVARGIFKHTRGAGHEAGTQWDHIQSFQTENWPDYRLKSIKRTATVFECIECPSKTIEVANPGNWLVDTRDFVLEKGECITSLASGGGNRVAITTNKGRTCAIKVFATDKFSWEMPENYVITGFWGWSAPHCLCKIGIYFRSVFPLDWKVSNHPRYPAEFKAMVRTVLLVRHRHAAVSFDCRAVTGLDSIPLGVVFKIVGSLYHEMYHCEDGRPDFLDGFVNGSCQAFCFYDF